jgi:hypothetical protein
MDEFSSKWLVAKIILVFVIIGLISFGINKCSDATHTQDAVIVYEEFQSVYETCVKVDSDLCSLREIPDDDKMFEQISKNQRITGLKANLNRWVNEYNAKSKMFGRSLWKSNSLPYQLNVNDFNCYNN